MTWQLARGGRGTRWGREGECGAVLVLVLIIAGMLNLLAASVIQSSNLQARMAGAYARQAQAQALADSVLHELKAMPGVIDISVPVGHLDCDRESPRPDCDEFALPELTTVGRAEPITYHYHVRRLDPAIQTVEVPPGGAAAGGAALTMDVALFELATEVDLGGATDARAALVMALAVPLTGESPWSVYWRRPEVDPL